MDYLVYLLLFLFLGALVLGRFFWRSNHILGKIIGILILGLPFSFIIALIGQMGKLFIKDPGIHGSLFEWLSYGFKAGLAPFGIAVGLIIGFVILKNYYLGSGDFIATPNAIGGYSLQKNDPAAGCGSLSLTPLLLAILPYGLIDGVSQWFLYRVGLHSDLLIMWLPVGIMTLLIWAGGILSVIVKELRK